MNEVNKFFADLPSEDKKVIDIFAPPAKEEATVPEKDEEPNPEDGRKNRRHRRLEEQLRAERESNIALNERVKVLSEVENHSKAVGEADPDLIEVFGDNDAGKKLAKIFEKKLEAVRGQARDEALQEIESRQEKSAQEQSRYEKLIDSELESLEDQFDVDLTSNAPAARKSRREFLELVQKFSPKDENGTITGFADFESTFEEYQNRQAKPDASRNKELASRSMAKSGPVDSAKLEEDATRTYLRSIGIRGI